MMAAPFKTHISISLFSDEENGIGELRPVGGKCSDLMDHDLIQTHSTAYNPVPLIPIKAISTCQQASLPTMQSIPTARLQTQNAYGAARLCRNKYGAARLCRYKYGVARRFRY